MNQVGDPIRILVPLLVAFVLGCAVLARSYPAPDRSTSIPRTDSNLVHEVTPRLLPLGPPLNQPEIEISGLAWYGDTLVVLPQYPARFAPEDGRQIYGLPGPALRRALGDSTASPIKPVPIPLAAEGVTERPADYEGYEALVFSNDHIYVLIESERTGAGMEGFLYRGAVVPGLRDIRLSASMGPRLPMQAALQNMAYEALTVIGDTVIALFEANGARVNPTARAYRYDAALQPAGSVPFPTLEYRLTDATALDADGRFWVMNYFYPGEREVLRPGIDSIAVRFRPGATHRRSKVVERLVEYRYTPSGIRRTDTPPIWLKLGGGTGRNWEGLARFGDGFLIATDQYPSTMLAYVPRPSPSIP